MWSNDKCCILFSVSFLIGESLDQIEISKEPHCLSLLSQAKLTFPYLAGCNCRASNRIIKLETFHMGVYTWGRIAVLQAMNLIIAGLQKESKRFWCVPLSYFKWDIEGLIFCYSALSKIMGSPYLTLFLVINLQWRCLPFIWFVTWF